MENNELFMNELRRDIDDIELKVIYFTELINIYKKEIDRKYKIIFKLCNHEWETKREHHMYGERYKECVKCGMCK